MTCRHGHQSSSYCAECRKEDKAWEKESCDFGVFTWTSDGKYPRENAVKIFKTRRGADAYCEKHYPKYVTRRLLKETAAK